MQNYTAEEFSALLTRTFARYRPRVVYDVDNKGQKLMEFILPNPEFPRFSISLQATEIHKRVSTCTLWFGQVEILGRLDPDMVHSAIETIVNDQLVAILRYKNEDAYDNHRPSGNQWLYQLTDDEDDDSEALAQMKSKLSSKPTLMEKFNGKLVGVFEVFRWSGSEIIRR